MRRTVLLAALCLSACGSQPETPARAPAGQRVSDSCQAMTAVATDGTKLGRQARETIKRFREAVRRGDALCASDVDQLSDDGWTPYAPLADPSPTP